MTVEQLEQAGDSLSFEKQESGPHVVKYTFNKVFVWVDTSGKNYKKLPEIVFGTFDTKMDEDFLGQPEIRRDGVDMGYISSCIKEVAKDSGLNEFWFYPFGDDRSGDEARRERVRLRLFGRYFNIAPAPGDFGYIVKI
jgi:hypothetical protein